MDQEADAGDDQRPHQRERIELQPEVEAGQPRTRADARRARRPPSACASFHGEHRQHERRADERRAEPARPAFLSCGPKAQQTIAPASGSSQSSDQQRIGTARLPATCCSASSDAVSLTSSTSTKRSARKVVTTMARPIAASAAATVITRKAKMWPALCTHDARERDEQQVRGVEHQLDAISMIERIAAQRSRRRRR